LALSIGPRKLFIAFNKQTIVREVAARKPDHLVAFVNNRIAKQARDFIIGVDDRQLRFVANRIDARVPSSPTETKPLPSPEEFAKIAAE
jgi:hypothetical protein